MDDWEGAEDAAHDRAVAARDHARLADAFGKAGFRDGVEAGRQAHMQCGFDTGFRRAAGAGFERGAARGRIEAAVAVAAAAGRAADLEAASALLARAAALQSLELSEADARAAVAHSDCAGAPSAEPPAPPRDAELERDVRWFVEATAAPRAVAAAQPEPAPR